MRGWNISSEFFGIPEVTRICGQRSPHDTASSLRGMILIKLLSLFADRKVLGSMEEALSCVVPEHWRVKHAMDVWIQCVTDCIIRKDGEGFSASAWMAEKGLVSECAKTDAETPKDIAAPTDTPKPEMTPQEQTSRKEPASTETETTVKPRPIKIQVSPCVFLTREELNELKLTYSDDDLSFMFDLLSDYKAKNPTRKYPSDMNPLQGWCARELRKKKSKPQQPQPQLQPQQADEDLIKMPEWLKQHRF